MLLPQMSPLWWTTLMMMFLITLSMTINYMYFNNETNFNHTNEMFSKNMNWKW